MIEGEDILNEAKDLSCQLLKTQVKHLDHYQARVTENTLEHPYHKSLPRFLDIISFTATILWLWDDIGSAQVRLNSHVATHDLPLLIRK